MGEGSVFHDPACHAESFRRIQTGDLEVLSLNKRSRSAFSCSALVSISVLMEIKQFFAFF